MRSDYSFEVRAKNGAKIRTDVEKNAPNGQNSLSIEITDTSGRTLDALTSREVITRQTASEEGIRVFFQNNGVSDAHTEWFKKMGDLYEKSLIGR